LCSQVEAVLGAKGTHNVDRLLRVPGTCNHPNAKKRALGRGETQSRLLRWTWRRYSWTELEQLAEHLRCNPLRHAVPCEPPRPRASLGDVALPGGAPEPLEVERVEELRARYPEVFDLARYDGDQSRQDLALASLARRLGWSQQDAWRLIIAVRGDQKAYRRDYIERTLARAYAERPEENSEHGTGAGSTQPTDPWPEPQPLPEGLPPVDPFPHELLPAAVAPWVADVAERMQVPSDYVAVAVMTALGSVLGRQIGIYPKRHDDWLVVPNLWGAIIGRPGLLKTPALQEALRPLTALECAAKDEHAAEQRLWEARREVEAEAKKLRGTKIKDDLKSGRSADSIAQELVDTQNESPEPTRRRFMTNNATIEKLGVILGENPNGVLLFRDELIGWLRSMEGEGCEADRAFYLEAWNGTGRFTYDRIGRGTVDIEAACLSVLGGIQPGPLLSYLEARAWDGAGDDGLLQRFQLAVWPDVIRGWRNVDRAPDAQARRTAHAVFDHFANLRPSTPALRFDAAAQRAFEAWRGKLEQRLRAGDLHPAFEAHLAKYRSLLPALALICHLSDNDPGKPVSEGAFDRAEAWCDYLETHATRIYAALEKPDQAAARALGERIQSGDVPSPFKLRDIYRRHWSGIATRESTAEAVSVLCDLGWLRRDEITTTARGGRPSETFHINPALRKSS
jgi:Protein of unknown function (DUF3987)